MSRGSLVRTWLLAIAGCATLLAGSLTAAHAAAARALTVDLSISLSDGGTPWTAQSNQQSSTPSGTWTLTVRNTGTVASSGTTTIIFAASATGSFLPSTGKGWSCADTGDRVRTCTNRTPVGAGGAMEPLSIPWVAFGGYGYAYATATLSNPSDHNASHTTASMFTPVVQQPAVDLSMSLSDGGTPWTAQSDQQSSTPSGTWTLRVRNTGTVASSGTTTIIFSASATGNFLPSTGKGWSCADTGDRVRTCTSGWSAAPGAALPPLTFPWVAFSSYGYANATATLINRRNGTINHSTAEIGTPVVQQPAVDLSMSLSDGGTPWTEQANPATATTPSGTWTLQIRNTGTAASSGTTTVTLNAQSAGDYLPSSGQDWSCAPANGADLTCTNPDAVPAGGALPPLNVPWATSSGYAEASVTLANPSNGTINHTNGSILTPVTNNSSSVDVVGTISDGGQPFTAGQQAVYTITVSNAGTSPAGGPTTVYYPVPFAGTVAAGTGWTCTPSDVTTPDCSYSGGIAAGSALPPITVTSSVPAQDAPASVQAAIFVDNPNDTFPDDNGAHVVTDVTPVPIDVVATISDGGTPFTAGQKAVYTIRVRNTGTSAASGTTTVDYPVVLNGAVATGTGWTCTPSDVATPECSHSGSIAAGSALPPITVTAPIPAQDAPAMVQAIVNVVNSSDALTNDNGALLDTDVTPRAVDVTADISDGGIPFATGHTAIYTVQVRNTGTSAAHGTTTVSYPVPFPGTVAEGTGWTCTPSNVGNPFCSNSSTIAAKSALPPLTIHAVVPSQDAPAEVRAEVSVDNPADAFTNDNGAFLDTAVTTRPPLNVIFGLGGACPAVMIMAVRGSGESPQDWTNPAAYTNDRYQGAGEVISSLYTALHHADRKVSLSVDPIMYPADSVLPDLVFGQANYTASVASGTETILTDMQLTDTRCHDHVRYILAGYSQGAWAVHDALHLMRPAQLDNVIGVALFGDPDFVPAQAIVRDYKLADLAFGDSALVDLSNVGVPRVPASLGAHSGSWCYPTDPVCQLTKHNITKELPFCIIGPKQLCPHFQYVTGGETAKAAKFLLPFLP